MNIEKQLEALRKALEDGAKVEIKFYDSKEKALEIMSVLDIKPEEKSSGGYYWIDSECGNLEVTGYYDPKEESA